MESGGFHNPTGNQWPLYPHWQLLWLHYLRQICRPSLVGRQSATLPTTLFETGLLLPATPAKAVTCAAAVA